MEENKDIKKKRMPLYLIAIAIVLAVLGVMDLKVNAAELYGTNVYIFHDMYNGSKVQEQQKIQYSYSYTSDSPMTVYLMEDISVPSSTYVSVVYFIVSDSAITRSDGSGEFYTFIDKDGKTKYLALFGYSRTYSRPYTARIYMSSTGAEKEIKLKQYYTKDEFVANYIEDTLNYDKPPINYDELEVDDSMPVIKEIKRNYIIDNKSVPGEDGITLPSNTYEYLVWSNGSSEYTIQFQTIPVVQYYKTLFGKSEVLEEFTNEWNESEFLEKGTSKYTRQTDDDTLSSLYNSDYDFKKLCLKNRPQNKLTETVYFFNGYRFRYVDEENLKASPWLVVLPGKDINTSYSFYEYSDGSKSEYENTTGEIRETFGEDIEDSKEYIDDTIEFKDKYDIIDGDADVGEITNWLNSVTGFIKQSPSVIGSVLGFLPQPILYGLYITIFLGVFATAIGIVKALI